MLPPIILNFSADNNIIVDGIPVKLSWSVDKKTHTVLLDNGIGDVTSVTEIKVQPEKNTSYTLKAIGHFGEIVQTVYIKVFPTPKIQSLFIPTPQFTHHTQLSNLRIGKPDINISVHLDTTLLQSSTLQFVEATKEIEEVEPKYYARVPNISNAFEQILQTIKQKFS